MPFAAPMASIHHLADYGGPYPGSFVPMLAATAAEAGRRGHHNTIWLSAVARHRAWLGELESLAEVRLLETAEGTVRAVRPTIAALRGRLSGSDEPVVLHTHFSTYDIPAALTGLTRRRTAVFWHEHTRLHEDRAARLRNATRYRLLGPSVDGMLCVSPEIRSSLRERHAPARRLIDFPNAIDLGRFPPVSDERRKATRREMGVADATSVILHFGWDWRRKGGDLMLDASERLGTDAEVLWLTVGADADADADAVGHRANVRTLPPTDDVSGLYAAADVFLSCSRAEGMPYSVLEALASGLPVVGTDLPGQRPLLSGLPGAAIVATETDAIADGVRRMLALSDSERQRHATLARERVQEHYSVDAWASRLVDLYELTLGPK
ncbi:MAG: glycosyltransferase [Solirubrobacteraceae bacterium]